MADTSRLNEITKFILDNLSDYFNTKFSTKKVMIGSQGIVKRFSGVSSDSRIILHICHHSGRTKGGNIPIGKLNGLYSKCYLVEKAKAEKKYIYFTNKEFKEIFKKNSFGIIEGIELKYFENMPIEYQDILNLVIEDASDEMTLG